MRTKDNVEHKPHEDSETIDEVRITQHERWKDSELSGDEWRFSFTAELRSRGVVVGHIGGHRLEDVALNLLRLALGHGGVELDAIAINRRFNECCDQPACTREPAHFFMLKKEYSRQGEALEGIDHGYGRRLFRKFCSKHKERGDCGLEDADDNYEEVQRSDVYEAEEAR